MNTYCVLLDIETELDMKIDLMIALDFKDLFATLSTRLNIAGRSIRPDVFVIRYEFDANKTSRIFWIPRKVNLANAVAKTNSPLANHVLWRTFGIFWRCFGSQFASVFEIAQDLKRQRGEWELMRNDFPLMM